MVRIGVVVVGLGLIALVLLGLGLGFGVVEINKNGIALAHHEDFDPSAGQAQVVSVDELLKRKEAAAVHAPAPAPTPAPVPTPAPKLVSTNEIRINAGATHAIHDADGVIWYPDDGFEGGSKFERGLINVENAAFPAIFRTEHDGMSAWKRKDLPNGKYVLKLHFAETWDEITDTQPRIFNMNVNGTPVNNFNIAKEAGGLRRALEKTFHLVLTTNTISITFTGVNNSTPIISAIEVIPEP